MYTTGARALEDQSGAVTTRALRVRAEYRRHARYLDAQFSAPGTQPILDRLDGYGEPRAAVFGAYGEGSPDVHHLIEAAATAAARARWRLSGARTVAELRSVLIAHYRRRVGMRAVQAMARYRLERVPFIGVPRQVVQLMARARVRLPQPAGMDRAGAADIMRAMQLWDAGVRVG